MDANSKFYSEPQNNLTKRETSIIVNGKKPMSQN